MSRVVSPRRRNAGGTAAWRTGFVPAGFLLPRGTALSWVFKSRPLSTGSPGGWALWTVGFSWPDRGDSDLAAGSCIPVDVGPVSTDAFGAIFCARETLGVVAIPVLPFFTAGAAGALIGVGGGDTTASTSTFVGVASGAGHSGAISNGDRGNLTALRSDRNVIKSQRGWRSSWLSRKIRSPSIRMGLSFSHTPYPPSNPSIRWSTASLTTDRAQTCFLSFLQISAT